MGRQPGYFRWMGMRQRCENPKHRSYARYGGRGIRVCGRWQSFAAFVEDMGTPPSPRHSIDRINGDGDYCPGNCRWALPKTQRRNSSANVRLTLNGDTATIAEWSERTGLDGRTIRARLRLGWTTERALVEPTKANGVRRHIEIDGERVSLTEAARRRGVRAATLSRRLAAGWSVEDAVTVPAAYNHPERG